MKLRFNYRILFIGMFLLSCLEEESIIRSYPKIITQDVSEITSSGALFSGTIESDLSDVIECGFTWGLDPEFREENSFTMNLGEPDNAHPSIKIESTLTAQKKYYVRFYSKTATKTIYANTVTFLSLGSEGPVIQSLSPQAGVLGDTITIKGKRFLTKKEKNIVKLGTAIVNLLTASDTTLSFVVPADFSLTSAFVPVSVSIEGNIATAPKPFELLLDKIIPEIKSIFPLSIKACDTITVVGKNFNIKETIMRYSHNSVGINLFTLTEDSIVFAISSLPPDDLNFSISTGNFELNTSAVNITELRPEIFSVSPIVYRPGEIITIKGKNFPSCETLRIAPNWTDISIVSKSENEIKVQLPRFCLGDFELSVMDDHQNLFLVTPTLKPLVPEIISIDPSHASIGEEITIRGKNFYFIDSSMSADFLDITSISENEIKGTVREVYAPSGKLDVVLNGCIGIVLENGFTYNPIEVLDFYPKTITNADVLVTIEGTNFSLTNNKVMIGSTTLQKDDLTFQARDKIIFPASKLIEDPSVETNFSLPITVQNGTGMTGTSSSNLTVTNPISWTKLADFPGPTRINAVSFSINGKGYTGLGSTQSGLLPNDLWQYTPETDSWESKAPFPGSRGYYTVGTTANGKAYVGLNDTNNKEWWEYNPSTDVWTRKKDFPGSAAIIKFPLELNGKVYVGGGLADDPAQRNEFWEYDPSSDVWSRKSDIPFYGNNSLPHFSFKGKAYFYTTTYNGEDSYECAYNPVTDRWTNRLIPDFYQVGPISFVYDDYVIVGTNFSYYAYSGKNPFYKIIPGSGSMIQVPYAGPTRQLFFGFAIGHYGYLGLGQSNVYLPDVWKFDPSKF